MIKFGKYQDELTWKEVLDKDTQYCEWVLNKGSQTQPRFREFQRWLIKEAPQPRLLYHYTDSKAAKKILGSGVLKPSLKSVGDAFHGDGVYFTSLDPETTSFAELHENNFDGARKYKGQEAYVVVEAAKVPRLRDASHWDRGGSPRDIFVAQGKKPLELSKVGGRLSWKKDANEYWF